MKKLLIVIFVCCAGFSPPPRAQSQESVIKWSSFNMGYAGMISAGSSLRSVVGQGLLGTARPAKPQLIDGFLAFTWSRPMAGEGTILILEDGGTQDSVAAILRAAGFGVTLGGPYWLHSGSDFDKYQMVIFLDGVEYNQVMPDSVQVKLRSYVANGGSLLSTEWLMWSGSVHDTILSILPVIYGNSWSYGSELYQKRAVHPISAALPDTFSLPEDWSYSVTERDTNPDKHAITIFSGSLSGGAVVAGSHGKGKVVHWNMGGEWNGKNIWTPEVKKLLVNIATFLHLPLGVRDGEYHPESFLLAQNYPNPFNPGTTIRFELPVESHVQITIYNVLGQELMKLLDERCTAGIQTVHMDGSGLPSGLYFYRIKAGDIDQTKKMLLLR